MWICMNDAFVSVVRDKNDNTRLVVRARDPDHIRNLFKDHDVKVEITPQADYIARVFIDDEAFAKIISSKIVDIDYLNFKNSVKDPGLYDMYTTWWGDHYQFQRKVLRKQKKGVKGVK